MKYNNTKTWIKRIGFILLIPLLLVLVVVVLIYIPAIQNFAVKKATKIASESLGMQIDIGHIHLSYPLNLNVQDITVIDNDRDTLLYSNNLTVDVHLLPLLDKKVSVRTLQLSGIRFNTKSLIKGMTINGYIGDLNAKAGNVNLTAEEANLNNLLLSDSYVTLRMDTTSSTDTTSSVVKWIIDLEKIQLENIAFDLQMPVDSLSLTSYFEDVSLTGGQVDLGIAQYKVSQFKVQNSQVNYDSGNQYIGKGLDPSHLALSEINLELESILYQGKNIHAEIPKFSLKEKSGLFITSLNAKVESDKQTLTVPKLTLETPYSKIEAQATVPWSSLKKTPQGNLTTQLIISLDKRDVLTVMGELAESVERFYPNTTFKLLGLVEGNLNKIYLRQLESELPGVFKIDAHGTAENVTDDVARSGQFYLKAQTSNDNYLRGVLLKESGGRYTIPDHLALDLKVSLSNGEYQADMLLSEQSGDVKLSGKYHPGHQKYDIDLKADKLALIYFLPKDSIFSITANVSAQGQGTNLFANTTWAQLKASLDEIIYKETPISGLSLEGSLKDNQFRVNMGSSYPQILANMTAEGNLTKEKIDGMLILNVDSLDLYGLQLADKPFTNTFQVFSEFETDLNKTHLVDVTLGNWEMSFGNQKVNPKTLTLHAKAGEDTTYVSFHAGDFGIYLKGDADVQSLIEKLNIVSNDVKKQLEEDSTINLQTLQPLFPEIDLQITAQKDNPIYNYLQTDNIFFDNFKFNATTSPVNGINANGFLFAFIKDTLKIDSMQLNIQQDSNKINYAVNVAKNRFRNQDPFKAGVKGSLQYGKGDLEATYLDGKGKTGLHLGARVEKQTEGWNIQLFPDTAVIAYLPFKINPDNYVLIKSKDDIAANLRMDGEEYASIWVHSAEDSTDNMDELSAELNQINLERLSAGFPTQLPSLAGNANLSLRYVPMGSTFMLVADANIDNLYYQKGRVGELLMSGVYLPVDKNRHQIDLHIFYDQNEISTLSALYQSSKGGNLDGKININQLPLMMANPFLAGNARLNGALQADMAIRGSLQSPLINGFLQMDTASIYATAAGSRFRLDDKKINIADSKIFFDKYSVYSAGNSPFVIDGSINFRNMSKGTADLTLTAKNMQLLDAKKDKESLVYGKLFVDLNSTVKGPLNGLTMRGSLHLLGGTNMSYILRESPLTVSDRMSGLVTFTHFRDTVPRRNRIGNMRIGNRTEAISLNSGINMVMTINIDPAVRIKVDLDEEASNRIELQGGGNLSFQYTKQGDMVMNGRYTLSDGVLKYDMPVIGNKTLNIKDESYVEWNGDVMDPYLNLKATEKIRTAVSPDGQTSRLVTFDAGVEIKQHLKDLSLLFTLDATDDVTMQNEIAALGKDEESKRAAAMLLTGTYLSDGQAGNFNMGSALNNILESEINNLTGDLLKDVDFSFGMETYDMAGGSRTDYSFRFSKRFYNDRLNVIVGSVLSTGQMANQNDNFLNDASLEYRLDRSGYRYAKLFYNRQYESLLEGEIARYGGGFIFRRKMRRLSELFGIQKKKTVVKKEVVEENKD